MENVLAILLAGGRGERLDPLTRDRAKPAVCFGGNYRIIDVTLSNCVNSSLRRILILTQYKALSLNRHIRLGWNILANELGEFIDILPPTKRVGDDWYTNTANAVFQNLHTIVQESPGYVLVLAADHIYKMNYALMVEQHRRSGAEITVATILEKPEDASRFGVAEIDADGRLVGFEEKPAVPRRMSPYNPDYVSASMGVYLFNTSTLVRMLREDALDESSSHDFGKNIIPKAIQESKVYSFNFLDENAKEALYWRDVGTLDAYYEANMDLVSVSPIFNLYDRHWPIRTRQEQHPPAKFVFASEGGTEGRRMGLALDSIVSPGCIVSGGRVTNSVLSPNVRINSYSEVDSSILFWNVVVGRRSRVRRAIIDRDVVIPENTEIGFDAELDRARGYLVTENGITVVPSPVQTLEGAEELDYRAE
jgi:glucose-1-phosphate adenylyltransferase